MPGHQPAPERPGTFGDLFAGRQFRWLFAATGMSWIGDYLARAAVTALVLHVTGSIVLSAGSFAIGYLPALTAGPVLAAIAERHPPRRIMVACDLVRAGLIGVLAVPGVPIGAVFTLLFAAALLAPPFDAARSSLLPRILGGERYVAAISVLNTTNSLTLVGGYFVGGLAGSFDPHVTLGIDAGTFAASAIILRWGLEPYTANMEAAHRSGLLRETVDGFRLVLGSRIPRSIVLLVLAGSLMVIVPEGLAAAWAAHLSSDAADRALNQALIMMSVPAGSVIASITVGRLVGPAARQRLIRPLAVVVPLAMVGVLANPPAACVTIMGVVTGFAMTGLIIPSNAVYVRAMPVSFRARAFGVMQFGTQIVQGTGLLVTGALADRFPLQQVVGYWAVTDLVLMAATLTRWPSLAEISAATTTAVPGQASPALAATPVTMPGHADGG